MKHILSCSFGKDSIATALLALQHGEPLDELVYCEVMFSEEISGELPEHNRFIHETAIPYFEQRGIPTRVLRSEKTYLSCFYHVVTRGKTKGMFKAEDVAKLNRIYEQLGYAIPKVTTADRKKDPTRRQSGDSLLTRGKNPLDIDPRPSVRATIMALKKAARAAAQAQEKVQDITAKEER